MSLEGKGKQEKQSAMKLTSASFVPKILRKKQQIFTDQIQLSQTSSCEGQNVQAGLRVLPPGMQEKTLQKNNNTMPYPSLLGGNFPLDINNVIPFAGGPMKPPPLLFSHPDNVSILPLFNSTSSADSKTKKAHLRYSAKFILSMRDQCKERPGDMKDLDFAKKTENCEMQWHRKKTRYITKPRQPHAR
ncbi:unnamed protein product [Moneuplotes crassus]|uniref:Uncharacterized protein n=1 Tax=Euplotes crassus TaxID=5936 RepID=A0AAD1XYI8_EUPCR|nr:unnamed protein product [Moneuplotes crassus]